MKIDKALPVWLLGIILLSAVFSTELSAQQERQMQEGGRQMQEKSPDADVVKPSEVKRSPIRAILNKITIGASIGYGMNHYRQELPYNIQRQGDKHYLSTLEAPNVWYSNWLSAPVQDQLGSAGQPDAQVKGDTSNLKLQGFDNSLPISLDLHVVLKDRFRIGGGLGLELFSIKDLDFKNDGDVLGAYQADVRTALAWRYYGMVGVRVIRWQFWDHSVDARIGKKNFLTKFDKADEGLFYNLGFTMERNYSEYFRLTLRPSLEWFSYSTLAATNTLSEGLQTELKTNVPSLYIQAGVSFNYPLLPRCPMDACHVQLEHVHYGKEFRGQPIHKWQNPKYGQNHPELQRNLRRKKDDTEQQLRKRPRKKKGIFPIFR